MSEIKKSNTSSLHEKIVLNNSIIDILNDFLNQHHNLSKDDVINKAILDYISNYDRLVIYSKKDSK